MAGKQLTDMSLEELWQLFPIFLTEHNPHWKKWYSEEETLLRKIIPESSRISHIGSTAIDDIWAKPIIDILVELPAGCNMTDIAHMLENNGYIIMSQNETRISLNKGYTENGFDEKVFHLHLRFADDNDELYFRDYLNEYPAIAREYEALKLSLWRKFEHDRNGYTEAKRKFVQRYTDVAKIEYSGKY